MKNLVTILFIVLFNVNAFTQKVLDAPFIYEKEAVFAPEPIELNHILYANRIMNKEQKEEYQFFKSNLPIYPQSYLFSEPEYSRVRLLRSVYVKNNHHLEDSKNNSYWYKEGEKWNAYLDSTKTKKSNLDKQLTVNTQLFYPFRQYLGVNIIKLKNDTNEYARGKYSFINYWEKGMNQHIKNNNLKLSSNGVLEIDKPYTPDSFEIRSFTSVIINALSNSKVSAFSDIDFFNGLSENKVDSIIKSSNFKITGYRIKEDYFIDHLTGKLRSSIIGIGLIGTNNNMGDEILWMYFPELRYCLIDFCAIKEKEVVNLEYLFDAHLNIDEIENYERLASYRKFKEDYHFSVKLDALMAIQLQQEIIGKISNGKSTLKSKRGVKSIKVNFLNDIANGEIEQYYDNGQISFKGIMKNGVCYGEFLYYYPSGKLKSKRNFSNGKPEGKQFNYYENGNLYAKYTLLNDEIISDLERYYPNGKLLEKGKFKNGLIYGDWQYRIECIPEIFDIIKNANSLSNNDKYIYDKDSFNLNVSYEHIYDNDCPINYFGNKYERVCFQITYK